MFLKNNIETFHSSLLFFVSILKLMLHFSRVKKTSQQQQKIKTTDMIKAAERIKKICLKNYEKNKGNKSRSISCVCFVVASFCVQALYWLPLKQLFQYEIDLSSHEGIRVSGNSEIFNVWNMLRGFKVFWV